MQGERRVPVFIINGFLESGKTTFIKNAILRDPNIVHERVVILCCEEGEIEFDSLPENIRIHPIEEPEELTGELLQSIREKYRPTYVIIEYNGVWGMNTLYNTPLPDTWSLAAQFTVISAETFDVYFGNMKSVFADMLRMSTRVYMNRCTRSDNFKLFKDGIKACAPRAEIYYMSDTEGRLDIMLEEDLPYDLDSDIIVINKDSYMTWYIDMLDNPDRYVGTIVEFEAQAARPPQFRDGFFLAGNMVMTCCEDDMQFLGFVCKYDKAANIKDGAVIKIRAEVNFEFAPEYKMDGPVLYVTKTTSMQAGQHPKKKKKK